MPHKDPEVRKAYWAAYYASDKGKANRQRTAEYRRKVRSTAEGSAAYYGQNIATLYGLSLAGYQALFDAQLGRCAICQRPQADCARRLAVDHCHATGVVRGLLCNNCNHAIGKLRDSADLMRAAAEYLEAPKPECCPVERNRAAYGAHREFLNTSAKAAP